jgi:outer membrane murein-binding lipoprotein Lpp
MKKFMILAVALVAFSGCASKSDLADLSVRVDALTVKMKEIDDDHKAIKSDHEAIKGDVADLSAKFDKAFVKTNLK